MDDFETENELIRINKSIDFDEFITPINDHSQKKKFLKYYTRGREYNPIFKYKKNKTDFNTLKEELKYIKTTSYINSEIKKSILGKIDFIENIKKDKTILLYNKPNKKITEKAIELINSRKSQKQERNIKPKIVKKIFEEYLKDFKIYNWKVDIKKKITSNLLVQSSENKVVIKNRNFSFRDVRTLLSHEIETHVLRAVNGKVQKYKILGETGTPQYLETEEGLATVMEDLNHNHNSTRFKFICARMIASRKALDSSFYETFCEIKENFNLSLNNAYVITKRVKRGLKDTSISGGYIKDHVYFQGREKIINYLEKGKDPNILFAGKFGIEDIKHLKELEPPKILPYILQEKGIDRKF